MFIIEKPYVSEFLVDTIVQNDWFVLDNEAVEDANIEEGAFNLCSEKSAVDYYLKQEFPLIYSNSENSIHWVLEHLPKSNLSEYIKLFKDKVLFRELLKKMYPDFYYKAVNFDDLKTISVETIKFPIILKPAVGFLSLGVHTIRNAEEWSKTLKNLKDEMKIASSLYPSNVINSSMFIIEEFIEGEEYAVDAYFDRNGDAVILNIFQHPFLNSSDVRDRIYIMSASIMVKYMAKFSAILREIGELKNIRNFPLHIELRVKENGEIVPIEINPMRFAGWCTTDVAKYAWGINVYEYFYRQKRPNWNEILENSDKNIYYLSMAEVPAGINKSEISKFDYESFLSNYSNVLEVRRINYKQHPLFAVIFGSTGNSDEIQKILAIDTKDYIIT